MVIMLVVVLLAMVLWPTAALCRPKPQTPSPRDWLTKEQAEILGYSKRRR